MIKTTQAILKMDLKDYAYNVATRICELKDNNEGHAQYIDIVMDLLDYGADIEVVDVQTFADNLWHNSGDLSVYPEDIIDTFEKYSIDIKDICESLGIDIDLPEKPNKDTYKEILLDYLNNNKNFSELNDYLEEYDIKVVYGDSCKVCCYAEAWVERPTNY